MFLQKDLFDGEGERVPMARSGPVGAGWNGQAQPRPSTAGSTAGDEGEDVATPGSVTNMRAKMMQQRERLLAKQRSAGVGGRSMVMANQSMVSEVSARKLATPGLGGSPGGSSFNGTATSGFLGHSTSGLTESGFDDDVGQGAVMPVAPPATKEEEEARRRALQQELSDRGITPEYDPASGSAFDRKSDFDIASVKPSEMRNFLHNPLPEHVGTIQCRIIRERSGISTKLHPKYTMESDSGMFLMTAQKQVKNKTSNYAVSMCKGSVGKDNEGFLGKLRSDFLGIEWVAYGQGLNPSKADPKMPTAHAIQHVREELVAIQYTASKWGPSAKGPRKMSVILPHVQPNGERLICRTLTPATEGLLALQKCSSSASNQLIDIYCNKPPVWNDTIGAYVLNFNKRVTEASVKNFQLVHPEDPKVVFLQFGRVGKETFNLDFRHPISPFQAFAMCLSSFDYKLGCE